MCDKSYVTHIWHILLNFCRRQQRLTPAGAKSGISKNSVKKTVRENASKLLSEEPRNMLHCGCFRARSDVGRSTSVATSLTEEAFSRKFLAVLLKPGVFLCYFSFVGTKESRPRRGNDISKDRTRKQPRRSNFLGLLIFLRQIELGSYSSGVISSVATAPEGCFSFFRKATKRCWASPKCR